MYQPRSNVVLNRASIGFEQLRLFAAIDGPQHHCMDCLILHILPFTDSDIDTVFVYSISFHHTRPLQHAPPLLRSYPSSNV